MPIQILPPEVSSQIAAGEVVERPASVVKELIENSIDSGAKQITVKIERGGRRLIEVVDDGSGIAFEELNLAVTRHATSKLTTATDLFHIQTLGFRGEALASIGSVARLTITSRVAESATGGKIHVEGGKIPSTQAIGVPIGTRVQVEDLFYNVPARLKFLKHENTERRVIDTLVTRYALAYPDIRFHLIQDDKPSLKTSGNGDRREVLAALYGVDVARQMLEVLAEENNIHFSGFISPITITRSHRREMTFFVNGRPVQDAALNAALFKAYHTLLMVGRYPVAIVFLTLEPAAVDVNVHPTKAEVRFREPDRIFTGLQNAIRKALLAYGPFPEVQPMMGWATPTQENHISRFGSVTQFPNGNIPPISSEGGQFPHPTTASLSQPILPTQRMPLLRLIGQIANTYLVAEGPDGLYLIDQHAAHERVLFERFMIQLGQATPSQTLLQPAVVNLTSSKAQHLSEQLPLLQKLGYQIETFGPDTFLIRAVPEIISSSDPILGLLSVVEDCEEDETPLLTELQARLIARICKRVAVKAGQALSHQEQVTLLSDLESCQSPRTCPHGRPTMIHLSVDLLERQFGRRGPHQAVH